LVLPRRMNDEDDHFAGGQPSVALRVPSHPMALALLTAFGNGIAAPSANLFGRVSPTTAHHVVEGLGRYLVPGRDAILDGGASQVGIESSIVDCTGEAPIILRPGAVTVEEIVRVGLVAVSQRPSHVRAPGTLVSHYAPQATVVVATEADMMLEMLTGKGLTGQGGFGQTDVPEQGLLALAETPTPEGVVRLAAPKDEADFARCLYAALHKADALRLTRVVVLVPPAEGIGLAIRDRVSRAASGARSAKGVGPGLPSVANHAAGR
jgi:L-threonylcarbamoyladenylate synthase